MSNSDNMDRLIPLRLQPGASSDPLGKSRVPSPSVPQATTLLPSKSILRTQPGPVTNSTSFPYTELEPREVMQEVKALYLKHQYKQCSVHCIQMLNSIKDPHRIHPLYQIYLSFFAASSLEGSSRTLHLSSSIKIHLLHQSLTYFQNAESKIESASLFTEPAFVEAFYPDRASISVSSCSSSFRSSIDSICSHAPSISSTASSVPSAISPIYPSNSMSKIPTNHKRAASAPLTDSGFGLAPAPLKTKKRVAFSLELPRLISEADLESMDDSTLLDHFPSPPSSPSASTISPTPPSPTVQSVRESIDSFLLCRALQRYQSHLSDLHIQLKEHMRSVEHQILEVEQSRKAWRSKSSNFLIDFGNGVDGVEEVDKKKVYVKARVEMGRQNGWRRERFDGRRYEVVCERALSELEQWIV